MDNFYAMAPIIYTPTVGWACSHFSHLYRRPRGMYFCKYDMGEMASMIYNWESDQVSPDTHTCNKQHMFADVGLLYQRFNSQSVKIFAILPI